MCHLQGYVLTSEDAAFDSGEYKTVLCQTLACWIDRHVVASEEGRGRKLEEKRLRIFFHSKNSGNVNIQPHV